MDITAINSQYDPDVEFVEAKSIRSTSAPERLRDTNDLIASKKKCCNKYKKFLEAQERT